MFGKRAWIFDKLGQTGHLLARRSFSEAWVVKILD
jgi:hypothetical protein